MSEQPVWGRVVEEDRGALPFALVHGEPLVACAAWAMGAAEITLVDQDTPWPDVVDAGATYVLHDALCPLTPVAFLTACVERSQADDAVVVGVRPVTDTVKRVEDGLIGATVDRATVAALASPVVLPPSVVATLPTAPTSDLVALVAALRTTHRVVLLDAPPQGRRVGSGDDVRLLEALSGRGGDPRRA